MNPASCGNVVEGTGMNEYLELNRMWLDDRLGPNSESKAISYSLKYIRSKFSKVKWIQSFADERCKFFGIVYQAANFGYYGEHMSDFWEWNNEVFHNIQMTIKNGRRRSKKVQELQKNKENAKQLKLRQFRYIFFIDKRWKKRCLFKERPYPKYYK